MATNLKKTTFQKKNQPKGTGKKSGQRPDTVHDPRIQHGR